MLRIVNGWRLAIVCILALVSYSTVAASAESWQIADSKLDDLDALLAAHPDEFAGLSVDPRKQRVLVRVAAKADRTTIRQLLTALPRKATAADDSQWTIVLVAVQRNTRTLDAIRTKLMSQEPWASLVKPVFAQIHVDIEQNVVALGVTSVAPELDAAIRTAFGPAVDIYITDRLHSFSRNLPSNDGVMSGGMKIKMSDGNHCTSGWPIRGVTAGNSILKGYTTAGHCVMKVGVPTSVLDDNNKYLGIAFAFRVSFSQTSKMDATWSQDTDAGVIADTHFLGAPPVEPRIYTGGTTSTTRRYVVGARTVRVGDIVCFGGAFTGENCKAQIKNLNATAGILIGGQVILSIPGVIEAQSTDGSFIGQPGDSGGPVYVKTLIGTNTVIRAVGAIEAGPTKAPSTNVVFVPIAKVVPSGYSLYSASCSLNILGGLTCTQ